MRSGANRPKPSRRKLIPKPGKPGKFRPLGIPTVADRVVQAAIKNILEPIFDAQFWHVSYGFRSGRGRMALWRISGGPCFPASRGKHGRRDETTYKWVIEGDIKGCFDRLGNQQSGATTARPPYPPVRAALPMLRAVALPAAWLGPVLAPDMWYSVK